jgi:hypothetical protein
MIRVGFMDIPWELYFPQRMAANGVIMVNKTLTF